MSPVWVILVVLCSTVKGEMKGCSVKTAPKAFTTIEECNDYAKRNYKPVPDCIQPLTIFYDEETK